MFFFRRNFGLEIGRFSRDSTVFFHRESSYANNTERRTVYNGVGFQTHLLFLSLSLFSSVTHIHTLIHTHSYILFLSSLLHAHPYVYTLSLSLSPPLSFALTHSLSFHPSSSIGDRGEKTVENAGRILRVRGVEPGVTAVAVASAAVCGRV